MRRNGSSHLGAEKHGCPPVMKRMIVAMVAPLACIALWATTVTIVWPGISSFETMILLTCNRIIVGVNGTLAGLAMARALLGMAGWWPAWRGMRALFVLLLAGAGVSDLVIALFVQADHLSAVPTDQAIRDTVLSGAALVLFLVHTRMVHAVTRGRVVEP